MKNTKLYLKDDGSADYSFFSPDCFHFSTKGHEASAVELWRSMVNFLIKFFKIIKRILNIKLTPVGQKPDKWVNLNQPIFCPQEVNYR